VIPFLWRFHEVHHLDRFLDTTSALRFHFGEVLLSALARAGVILLLGFPFVSMVVFEVLVLAAAIFHHSNLRLPAGLERALSRVVITPSIHWVHHHARRIDTDSNYGTVFSFWDPLFGTRSAKRRDLAMPIGTEGRGEEDLPALLLHPFRSSAQS
jgi:sterol desaturase/sphingolipid hydroxylase (fatty acid hydroxylase superfamily)